MQKVIIKDFGPIKDVSLEIKDLMVFVGPQASGKSTIAKVIFFFKSLRDDLIKYLSDSIDMNLFDKPLGTYGKYVRQKYLDYFGPSTHLSEFNLIYYYSNNIYIEVYLEKKHKYITPKFSPEFEHNFRLLIKECKEFSDALRQKYKSSSLTSKDLFEREKEKSAFLNNIKKEITTKLFFDDRELIFVPAGRSIISTLSDQIQEFNPRQLDFLMRTFLERVRIIRPFFNKSFRDILTERDLLPIVVGPGLKKGDFLSPSNENIKLVLDGIKKILKGEYKFDKSGEKIFYDKNNYVKLNFASSGQQEVLWILLLLFIIALENQKVFIVIEEPEAHLYPEAQREMVNLIALALNINENDKIVDQTKNQAIITTHSPYILASFNNLIYADKVGRNKNYKEEISKIIPQNLWIKYENVFAGIVKDGKVREIIDDELKIIKHETIDEISHTINEEFDKLQIIEIENEYK
jgi:predicted ATP-dependent endonuclease of OLD family